MNVTIAKTPRVLAWVAVLACGLPSLAWGQYSKVTTPLVTTGSSFYERIGFNFGFNIPGSRTLPGDDRGSGVVGLDPTGAVTASGDIEFRQNGFGSALPPFGGYAPGSGLTGGYGVNSDEGSAFFNFEFAQGSDRNLSVQSPSVVVPNGGRGFISDTTQRPFVTGLVPVVGGIGLPAYPPPTATYTSPLQEKLHRLRQGAASSAGAGQSSLVLKGSGGGSARSSGGRRTSSTPSTAAQGDLSVAEIRRQQAARTGTVTSDLDQWIERAQQAESAGKRSVAKVYYEMAARRATGDQQRQLQAKAVSLGK